MIRGRWGRKEGEEGWTKGLSGGDGRGKDWDKERGGVGEGEGKVWGKGNIRGRERGGMIEREGGGMGSKGRKEWSERRE